MSQRLLKFGQNIDEKYYFGKCLPYEDPEVFKSTQFDLQIKLENSGLNVPKTSDSCLPLFGQNLDENYFYGKCLPYEDPEVIHFDLQMQIENSTPVGEKSFVLYVLDPLYPLYRQICDAKLEPAVERRKEKESGPAEELMTLLN
jgi:hypothetical protein